MIELVNRLETEARTGKNGRLAEQLTQLRTVERLVRLIAMFCILSWWVVSVATVTGRF